LSTRQVPQIDANCSIPAYDRFRVEFRDALTDYAHRLRDNAPDLIVAISRKGPRLLQLMEEIPEVPSPDLSVCVSEKALPFLPPEQIGSLQMTLTDDTIAYGSTFARNHQLLTEAGGSVRGEVMAMSANASPGVRSLLAHDPLILPEARVHQLIDLEIQAFGALAVPYDIDHPIFTIPFRVEAEELASQITRQWPEARRPTNPWHEAHGVQVLSLPAAELVIGRHSQAGRRMGPQKLRLFVDGERQAVRAVGIFALALRERELRDPELFAKAPEELAQAWRSLLGRVESGGWAPERGNYALANAAHYLAGCEALWLWLGTTELDLDGSLGCLSELDQRLLFGPAGATELHQPLQNLLRESRSGRSKSPPQLPPQTESRLDVEDEIAKLITTERGRAFAGHIPRYLELAAGYDPGDIIHSFFNAQRRTYDEETRKGAIATERLTAGLLPFPVVVPMIRNFGAEATDADFDHFADLAIDGGSIVPHYTPALSAPDLWVRGVRAGERGSQKLKQWVHRCASEAQRAYELAHQVPEDQRGLPWYVSEKMFAVLVSALEPELRSELGARIACGRDQFGARAALTEIPTEPFLLSWALDLRLLERHRRRPIIRNGKIKARGDVISAAGAFRELYPDTQDTVSRSLRQISNSIIDAFIVIDALFEGEKRNLALLAISSCNTYDAYLRSLSAELQSWLTHGQFNAYRQAIALSELAGRPDDDELANQIATEVQRSATPIAQTDVKRRAYESRVAVRDRIDAICRAGRSLTVSQATAWEDYIRPLIDECAVDNDRAAQYLHHASCLAKQAISIVRTMLDKGAPEPEGEERRFELPTEVKRYRDILAKGEEGGLNYSAPSIDEEGLLDPDPRRSLKAAAILMKETHESVEQIWETWRQPPAPDALDPFPDVRSLLLWDIIGSSDNPEAVQEAIHRVNSRVREELEKRGPAPFSPDQDDGNALVLPTAKDAFELFLIVSEMFAVDGISIRAGIETTTDGRSLQLNRNTGQFAGVAYAVAARTMSAFGELSAGKADYRGWESEQEMVAPSESHLLVTERTLKQLREREHIADPPGVQTYGVIQDYMPRVGGTLSTNVTCFVPARLSGD